MHIGGGGDTLYLVFVVVVVGCVPNTVEEFIVSIIRANGGVRNICTRKDPRHGQTDDLFKYL
jgi:hypothetical protein